MGEVVVDAIGVAKQAEMISTLEQIRKRAIHAFNTLEGRGVLKEMREVGLEMK